MTDLHSRPVTDPAESPAEPGRTIITPKPRPRRLVRRTLKHVVMVAASLAMIYPLLWMVVSSLRPNDEIFRNPSLWPLSFNFENFVSGWNALAHPFSHYLMNSTLLVLGCVIGNLVACSLTAYARSEERRGGNGGLNCV